MTALSEQMKDKICVYCGNNQGGFFTEHKVEKLIKAKRDYSRRKVMRSLVETF
jgi:hypothetical protein